MFSSAHTDNKFNVLCSNKRNGKSTFYSLTFYIYSSLKYNDAFPETWVRNNEIRYTYVLYQIWWRCWTDQFMNIKSEPKKSCWVLPSIKEAQASGFSWAFINHMWRFSSTGNELARCWYFTQLWQRVFADFSVCSHKSASDGAVKGS